MYVRNSKKVIHLFNIFVGIIEQCVLLEFLYTQA